VIAATANEVSQLAFLPGGCLRYAGLKGSRYVRLLTRSACRLCRTAATAAKEGGHYVGTLSRFADLSAEASAMAEAGRHVLHAASRLSGLGRRRVDLA
jgi:hypothetical protein